MIKLKSLLSEVNIEKIEYPYIQLPGGAYKQGSVDWHIFNVGKYYDAGDVSRYIHTQHPEFEEDDRVEGIYKLLELDPNTIPETEWATDDDSVDNLSKSTKEYPPIVINRDLSIVDGGHRLAASKLRGDKTIRVFKQI